MQRGDKPLMGSMVVRGEGEGTVESTGKETFLGRAAALMNAGGNEMSSLDKYVVVVVVVVVVVMSSSLMASSSCCSCSSSSSSSSRLNTY